MVSRKEKKSMGSIELSDFNLCLAKFGVFAEPIKTISSSKTKRLAFWVIIEWLIIVCEVKSCF